MTSEIIINDEMTSRTMSKIERYGWTVKDQPGEFLMVSKDQLSINKAYQRDSEKNEGKLLRLSKEWSWMACGVLIIADRLGKYYVIDGGHRLLAAKKRKDITELPCLLFETQEEEEEAQGFLNINVERRPLRIAEKFNALLAIKNPDAIFVNDLLKQAGRPPSAYGNSTTIACLGSLLRASRTGQREIERIWPLLITLCHEKCFHRNLVEALHYIECNLENDESLMNAKWKDKILSLGYENLLSAAHKSAAYLGKGGEKSWAIGILNLINKKMRYPLKVRTIQL